MLSFWEKREFINYDFAIIGSGIVGLSTALSLREKKPDARILVLERGIFPTGASTKNAGFACFGSLSEIVEDLKMLGESACFELVSSRLQGLEKLRSRLGDEQIDYQNHGGYELLRPSEEHYLAEIDSINKLLHPLFSQPVFNEKKEAIKAFGFNRDQLSTVLFNPFEGQIDTGKMMQSLLTFCRKENIEILTGAQVEEIRTTDKHVALSIKEPVSGKYFDLFSNKVAICTNAFSKTLLPELELNPGRGIVLVTKPIKNLPFKGVFHFDCGYYYFRNFGNRVLFGGGRNIDFDSETTTDISMNPIIETQLINHLTHLILPNVTFEIDHSWAGIMAFGPNKIPVLKKINDRVVAGVRLGGMGVAIGSNMGEDLAALLVKE